MTLPQILKSNELLNIAKEKLLKQEDNIEILQQVQYKNSIGGLPSLKTQSFILYKNLQDDSLHVVKTENQNIEPLTIEDFKQISNNLPKSEQDKLGNIIKELELKVTSKKLKKPF